jgi:hypothetical protein
MQPAAVAAHSAHPASARKLTLQRVPDNLPRAADAEWRM